MLVCIREHPKSIPDGQAKFEARVLRSWVGSHAHKMLEQLDVDYEFCGIQNYSLIMMGNLVSHRNQRHAKSYVDYVVDIDEDDYVLVKVALGEVQPANLDKLHSINDSAWRESIGLPPQHHDAWERDLHSQQ